MPPSCPSYDPFNNAVIGRSVDGVLSALPVIGIDECANNSIVAQASRQWVRDRRVLMTRPLWHQLHVDSDGHTSMYSGSANRELRERLHLGEPVPRHSWPDRYVVQLLIAHFGMTSSIGLLTENRSKDQLGLKAILSNVIEPAMQAPAYAHLSLTVFMKRGRTSWSKYTESVSEFINRGEFERGYVYREW